MKYIEKAEYMKYVKYLFY